MNIWPQKYIRATTEEITIVLCLLPQNITPWSRKCTRQIIHMLYCNICPSCSSRQWRSKHSRVLYCVVTIYILGQMLLKTSWLQNTIQHYGFLYITLLCLSSKMNVSHKPLLTLYPRIPKQILYT